MTRREAEQVAEAMLGNETLRTLLATAVDEAAERRRVRERRHADWISKTVHSFPGISPPYGPCRHCGIADSPETFNQPCSVLRAREPGPSS